MGEQTTPEIIQALRDGGHTAEAQNVTGIMAERYGIFRALPYPYASEYTYDNTGEEAVYMVAKMNGDGAIPAQINAKTRACRGQEPVWYYYADPVTNNGENWWQLQYTASLAGYCMDDWLRSYSTTPEIDERLSYAAKIANISAINSGQIDSTPANLGTVAWAYQGMKGNVYVGSPYVQGGEGGSLKNGWRSFSGEADLGLFGALRILSSDVAVDPVFGLFGYGCDVTRAGACYAVTPRDGVFERLNFVTQRLSVALDRDRYAGATVSPYNDYVGLTLQNQTASAPHTTNVTLFGLAPGTYPVSVDGASAGAVTSVSGQPAVVALSIGTGATYAVQIGVGCGGSTAGSDAGGAVAPDAGAGSGGGTSSGAGASSGGGSGASSGGGGSGGSGNADAAAGGDATLGGAAGASPGGEPGSVSGPERAAGCACTAAGLRSEPWPAGMAFFGGLGVLLRLTRGNFARRAAVCARHWR
jgi:Family of unknown function (DUF5695)